MSAVTVVPVNPAHSAVEDPTRGQHDDARLKSAQGGPIGPIADLREPEDLVHDPTAAERPRVVRGASHSGYGSPASVAPTSGTHRPSIARGPRMKIAMIGTRGVPARYGGFETAVEEIGQRLVAAGHQVTVYCRNRGQRERSYGGMRLVNLPAVRVRSLETITHSGISIAHAIIRGRPDAAFVFNAANAPYLPFLRAGGIPTAVHIDGLEWKRAKWAGNGARYYRWAERRSVLAADAVIADAQAIADHVSAAHGRDAVLIPYGAPVTHADAQRLVELDLQPDRYHLVVARFEPENHVREIVAGYVASCAALPLVVVGSAPYSDAYRAAIKLAAGSDPRVRLIGSMWDQDLLDALYGHARSYLHGHSVGGTNPSLLRAMGAGAPVSVFDCPFNREVTAGCATFFRDPSEVGEAVLAAEADENAAHERGERGRAHAAATYRWEEVAKAYDDLAQAIVVGKRR